MGKPCKIYNLAQNPKAIFALCAIWCVLCAALFTAIALLHENTLSTNGNWICAQLENPTRTSYAVRIMSTRRALLGNCLTPGGHDHTTQFITTAEKYPTDRIKTKIKLTPQSWGGFVFNKTPSTVTGVIVSTHPLRPSMFFQVDDKMLFTKTLEFSPPPLVENKFFELETTFTGSTAEIFINSQPVAKWKITLPENKTPGFVSGTPECSFDDFRIWGKNSEIPVFTETFSNTKNMGTIFALCLLVLAASAYTGYAFAIKTKSAFLAERLIELSIVVLLLAASIAVTLRFSEISILNWNAQRNNLAFGEEQAIMKAKLKNSPKAYEILQTNLTFQKRHIFSSPKPQTVVVIGDSQTWGEGLKNLNNSFDQIAQRLLEKNLNTTVNCVNLATRGYTASDLLKLYSHYISNLKPIVCIINNGYTDFHKACRDKLKPTLESFIKLNEKYGVKTVFIAQSTNPEAEFRQLHEYLYEKVVQTGLEHNIPVWDLNSYMPKFNNRGFVWYDYVHFSETGHRFAGAFVAYKLAGLLKGQNTCDFKKTEND